MERIWLWSNDNSRMPWVSSREAAWAQGAAEANRSTSASTAAANRCAARAEQCCMGMVILFFYFMQIFMIYQL